MLARPPLRLFFTAILDRALIIDVLVEPGGMTRTATVMVTLGTIAMAVIAMPGPSRADNGQVAAGIIWGLAVGTLFGAATAQPRYYGPPPAYVAPAPVYMSPPPCYWTYGRPVWDGWRGAWVRPRIQVCE